MRQAEEQDSGHRGATIGWTFIFLIIFLVGIEGIFRIPKVQARLAVPSIGLPRSLDYKLHYLEQMEANGDRVNCIFFGSSVVMRGVQAELFSEALSRETGQSLTCFNFGLAGTSGPLAETLLAGVLVQKFQPEYFFYGVAPEQLATRPEEKDSNVFVENDWVQYRSGNFNPGGWLTDHSRALRYFKAFHLWLVSPGIFNISELTALTPHGDSTLREVRYDVTMPPDPVLEGAIIERYSTSTLDNERLVALEGLFELDDDTMLIIFTPPTHRTFDDYFGENLSLRTELNLAMADETANFGIPLIEAPTDLPFEDKDWIDRSHLNPSGAVIFTDWLAVEVAQLLQD